jgi:hypothetical protein
MKGLSKFRLDVHIGFADTMRQDCRNWIGLSKSRHFSGGFEVWIVNPHFYSAVTHFYPELMEMDFFRVRRSSQDIHEG